jgi:hypothetical protein
MSGPLKIGAEPRKVAALAGLLVLAAGIYFWNSRDSNGPTASVKTAAPSKAAFKRALQNPQGTESEAGAVAKTASPTAAAEAARDFRPTMKRKSDEAANPEQFDPTLRTDLIEKLASVRIEQVAQRSLFDFSNLAAPAHPQLPAPKIVVQTAVRRMIGPELPPPPPAPPVKPPPPPITLKFYGRALPLKGGVKRVFCLINDEVKIPAEGDVLQRRYKIRRITPTSVLVEDLQSDNQQTLPIEEPAPGSQ